jgi:hypothetical protein
MLGQFFSSRKGAGAPHPLPNTTLDSATEESHTRHLLYPDTNTLHHPEGQPYPLYGASLTLGSGHDGPLPEIDLEFPRDCRIIIAQDDPNPTAKTILFDSKPAPPRAETPPSSNARSRLFGSVGGASTAGPSFGGLHARRSSLVTEPTPRSPTVGTFNRARTRGNSISSMPYIDEHSQIQKQAQARAKESTDMVAVCLECMFGNTQMTFRGNSNKIHIVPLESRSSESNVTTPNLQDTSSSFGKTEGFRRRSHLAKSYTPSNIPPELPRTDSSDTISKDARRRTIFITRTFSVSLPVDDQDSSNVPTPTPQSSLGTGNGFPFPRANSGSGSMKQPQSSQPPRIPMYAITIILQLPVAAASTTMRPASRHSNNKAPTHMSTSVPGHDSLGSSLDSDRRAGWSVIDSNFGEDSLLSISLNSDVDDRVDVIGQHWDVITRTLTSLQFIVQERILSHLKKADAASPPVPMMQHPRAQPSRSSMKEATFQVPRRSLKLQPNALAFDLDVKRAVELAGNRVVTGMRIPRVMTGQGKWGVWREEARWLGRWAGRREENSFFFKLLTAFLGNHTEWLNLLGPKWHRKRHREQQKSSAGENLTIPNRTIIVSPDKMAARRLIFLLSAFLPANTATLCDGTSPLRPSTSASLRAYSQSPPTNMPPSRKQSLRRQINRRPRGKSSLTSMRLQAPTMNGTSLSTLESSNGRSDSGVVEVQETPKHSRQSSAHSIHTGLVIPSMSEIATTTKSGTATMSTVAPQSTVPVAHFTLPRTKSSRPSPEYRPESSDSLASTNLMHTLQRSGTGHISSPSTESSSNSRWSGFMSFWSGSRRNSSVDHSDFLQSTDDGVGVANSGSRGSDHPQTRLEQMVQEVREDRDLQDSEMFHPSTTDASSTTDNSPEAYPIGSSSGVPASAARPIPERPRQFDSALKLSVNEKDGVIDVDISLPDFGSPLQSPLFGGYTSGSSQHGSSFGESSLFSMPYCEPDQPVNAAGWLKQFHPDFAVQAIKPYAELIRDVKRGMSAEPTPATSAVTPTLEQGPLERWVDVCSALIADTRTFSVKRILLRRLVKLIPTPTYQQTMMTPGISGMPARSQYGNPYSTPYGPAGTVMTEQHLAHEFTEETILTFDVTLIDALDRVLAPSGQGSRAQSVSSSRSSSRRGRRDTRSGSDAGHHLEVTQTDCKGIIFDALENVVKTVNAERNLKLDSKAEINSEEKPSLKPGQGNLGKSAPDSSLRVGIRRWLVEVE